MNWFKMLSLILCSLIGVYFLSMPFIFSAITGETPTMTYVVMTGTTGGIILIGSLRALWLRSTN